MQTLAELLRLSGKPEPKKKEKSNGKNGTSKEDVELAIKEYEKTKSARSFKALCDLAADYYEEEE